MNRTGFPTRFSASLLATLALVLGDGIGMKAIAAELLVESFKVPLASRVTYTEARTMRISTDVDATVAIGSSFLRQETQPTLSPRSHWPAPVNDQEHRLLTLIDVLEYRPKTGGGEGLSDYRWDVEGWYGGDFNRVWFKSEGHRDTAFKADYNVDFQLLYGRFIRKYYDFQIGPRVETQTFRGRNVTRGLGVVGIEGVVPYDYDFESALFIDENGAVSARLSFTKDLLLTQRLILQTRFETNAAVQRVEEFTTGSGLNNLEFGVRLRYEIRREFAPYVGVSLDKSFGETASLVRQEGGDPSQVRFVVGVRAWF
ncbi:MAG TPA: copper resistance protein B [Nitrospiraceae bacterium]|nr:copper resistance protein B [Nitrospiraceae bacterium]